MSTRKRIQKKLAKRAALITVLAASSVSPMVHGRREAIEGQMHREAVSMRPNTINERDHTVDAVITTEDPARFWSFDEVLLMSGMQPETQVPLIRDHRSWDSENVIGSVLNIRTENDEAVAKLWFDTSLDESVVKLWKRVAKGHLRRYSIGYRYGEGDYVDIPAGQSRLIEGRTFVAKNRTLRVVTRWLLDEVSTVVVPADRRAQSRHGQNPGTPESGPLDSGLNSKTQPVVPSQGETMDPIVALLHSLGCPTTITERSAALTWYNGQRSQIKAEDQTRVSDLCRQHNVTLPDGNVNPQRSATNPPANPATAPVVTTPVVTLENTDDSAIRAAAIESERQRVRSIQQLADMTGGAVPNNVVRQAIDEGWDQQRAQAHFAGLISGQRGNTPDPTGNRAPAGHVIPAPSLRSLQAALLEQVGIRADSPLLRAPEMQSVLGRRGFDAGWLASGVRQTRGAAADAVEQAFDQAGQQSIRGVSFMRLCEELLHIETGQRFLDHNEIMERSQSSGNFTALFGLVTHVMMMQGYLEAPATYSEFCRVIDVPDLRKVNLGETGDVGRLQKQGVNGAPAALLNVDAPTVREVKADRYGGQLKLTEQVILGGSFGALDELPRKVGESARRVITDMGFAVLLKNTALFHADYSNLIADGVMSTDGLQAALTMLLTRKVGDKRITWNDILVMCGVTLSAKTDVVLTSAQIGNQKNPHAGKYKMLVDNAVDLGVDDPRDNYASTYAGLPNSFYVFARPSRSVVVAFREGTNRAPVTRSANLDKGEWGRVWDVFVDCGAGEGDRIAAVRVDQAAS